MEIEPRCFGSGEKQKKTHKVDKLVLELFWPLAEGDDTQRVKAAEKLVQRLLENKTQDAETYASQQTYCLQRLVRGLASSRKFARVGYAVALTKMLREMKDIKIKHVLEVISEELKVSGHDPKSDVGSKLLGRVFAYGAVMQSERKLKGEQLSTVVSDLLALGDKKSYIRPSCTQTLMDLIGCVTPEALNETVWPLVKDDLDKGWEECTPDRLLLLMACQSKDKSLVDKAYLKTHWGAAKILGKTNLEHLLQLFRRSVESPQLQPLLLEVVTKEMTKKVNDVEDLKEFWTKVGNPLMASTVPRKQLALSLFCHLLEQTSDLTLAESMLFPAVASVICKTCDRKDDPLVDLCAKAESLLVQACKVKENAEAVLSIVTKFMQTCYRLKSYNFLRSNTLSTLVSQLQGESAQEFSEACMECMLGRGTLILKEEEKEDDAKQRDKFSQQLVPLLRIAAMNPAMQESGLTAKILQFLLLRAFFKVTKASKDIPHCQEVGPDFSPTLRSVCEATFFRTLTQLLSTRHERQSENQQLQTYVQVLSELAVYTQRLLSCADSVQPVRDISQEVLSEWQKIVEIVTSKSHQKLKSSSSVIGETETFTLLILHLAFDLFVEPDATRELLQDIYVCRQKAAKKQKPKGGDEGEPEWMEVTTEILLSMLSRASKLARKTTVTVFRSLSPHLTPAAVGLIAQVLKADKSKKDDLFEFEDAKGELNGKADADEDEEENSEDNDDDDDDKDEELPTDEDDSDDDDDDDDEEVDDELRRSVKAALGSAAVTSDGEEEEEDLSDSEMFKLDEQLAAAFRFMKRPTKKEKKEKQREVANFRLRALDLLEVIVKGDRCGDFAMEILESLLPLVMVKFKGQQGEGQWSDLQHLSNRATELFHSLCKQRNLTDHIHSEEEMLEMTNNLLQLAQSGSNPQLLGELANGCLCVMRLMSHQPDASGTAPDKSRTTAKAVKKEAPPPSPDGQEAFVQAVQQALEEDLLKRKNSKYSMAFFSAMIQKYPSVFWPLFTTVRKALKSEETKVHTKTQACALLGHLLHYNKRSSLSEEQWNSFFSTVPPTLTKMVMSQQKDALKSGLLLEMLSALFHIAQMSTVEERKTVLTSEVLSHLTHLKSAFNKDTRKMHNKLTQLLAQQNKDKAGKKRKQADGESTTENGTSAKKKKKKEKLSEKSVQNGD